MNPQNEPDLFEGRAIDRIKSANLKEFSQVEENRYRYARALAHKESCIRCHGDPADAPADVIKKYGKVRGFGFKAGDVAVCRYPSSRCGRRRSISLGHWKPYCFWAPFWSRTSTSGWP